MTLTCRTHLVCPYCGSRYSRVIDVRDEPRTIADQLTWSATGLWRKRRCVACLKVFITSEETVRVRPPTT